MRTKTVIALLLCAVIFVMAAVDMPYSQRKKVRKTAPADTTAVAADSIKDSIAPILRDSLGR